MKILFVDDEARVLDGMRSLLATVEGRWDARFAMSGNEALEILAGEPADVVVADMRMPGMDGAELLGKVQLRSPETMRILLSGHADHDAAFRALNVAHRFLAKPYEARVLADAVDRYSLMQGLLQSEELKRLVGSVERLPAAPRVFKELWRTLTSPQQDATRAAVVIGRDPALTAKVLQLANSAFLRRGAEIDSIHTAVTRIGIATLRTLVLATEVFTSQSDVEAIAQLQLRALSASSLARRLAVGRADAEIAATGALLADVGLLLPLAVQRCRAITANGRPVTHAEVGAYLLGLWGLPMPIVEAVAYHHTPAEVPQHEWGPLGVVHVAVSLALGDSPDLEYLERMGVTESLEGWRRAAENLLTEIAA